MLFESLRLCLRRTHSGRTCRPSLLEFPVFFSPTKRCSGYGSRLKHQKSHVRFPSKVWMSNSPSFAPPVVALKKMVDRTCQVYSLVALVDLAVQSFPWFFPKITIGLKTNCEQETETPNIYIYICRESEKEICIDR